LRWLLVARHRDRRRCRLLKLCRFAAVTRLAVAAHLKVGWGARPRLAVTLAFALGIHDAEIVFGVLIKVFRRNAVAARLRFSGHRNIPLEHLIGVAANFDVRAVAVESLYPMRQARPVVMWTKAATATATATATVTAA
jgi:hypothetical protein